MPVSRQDSCELAQRFLASPRQSVLQDIRCVCEGKRIGADDVLPAERAESMSPSAVSVRDLKFKGIVLEFY